MMSHHHTILWVKGQLDGRQHISQHFFLTHIFVDNKTEQNWMELINEMFWT